MAPMGAPFIRLTYNLSYFFEILCFSRLWRYKIFYIFFVRVGGFGHQCGNLMSTLHTISLKKILTIFFETFFEIKFDQSKSQKKLIFDFIFIIIIFFKETKSENKPKFLKNYKAFSKEKKIDESKSPFFFSLYKFIIYIPIIFLYLFLKLFFSDVLTASRFKFYFNYTCRVSSRNTQSFQWRVVLHKLHLCKQGCSTTRK